jgi:hypothetical protein
VSVFTVRGAAQRNNPRTMDPRVPLAEALRNACGWWTVNDKAGPRCQRPCTGVRRDRPDRATCRCREQLGQGNGEKSLWAARKERLNGPKWVKLAQLRVFPFLFYFLFPILPSSFLVNCTNSNPSVGIIYFYLLIFIHIIFIFFSFLNSRIPFRF